MTLDLAAVLRDVRACWSRDRALLWPLSGLLFFLPQYALLLLVPAMPPSPPGATIAQWSALLQPWVAAYGGWYVAATLVTQYGTLVIVSAYAAPPLALGAAAARAARLFARALVASLLVSLPCGVLAMLTLPIPGAPLFALPVIVYILGRTVLANPVIVGERGTGAAAAVARSWALTRGQGLRIAGLVGAIMVGGQVLSALALAAEHGLRAASIANPVALAIVDAGAALATAAAALLLALVQVALYARSAR